MLWSCSVIVNVIVNLSLGEILKCDYLNGSYGALSSYDVVYFSVFAKRILFILRFLLFRAATC